MVIARWKSRIWQKNCVWSLNFSLMQIFEGRINCVNQEEVTFEQRRHRKVVFALKSFFLKAVVVVGNSQMRVEVNSGLNKIVKENMFVFHTRQLSGASHITLILKHFTLTRHINLRLKIYARVSHIVHDLHTSHFTLHASHPHFKTIHFILKVCVSHFKIAYYTSKLRLTLHTRISHLKLMVFHYRVLHFAQSLLRLILYMLLSRRWQYFSVLMTIWQQRGGRRWWPLSILYFDYVFFPLKKKKKKTGKSN